jgi:hypothetical protein
MLPVLPVPGDWVLTAAVLGSPLTLSVTLPVLPERVSVAVMVLVADPENTSGAESESDTERLPAFPPPPLLLLADPPQPDKTVTQNESAKKPRALIVMSQEILTDRHSGLCDVSPSAAGN